MLIGVYGSGTGTFTVDLSVSGGTHQTAPSLSPTSVTVSDGGMQEVWLRSGDLVDDVVVTARIGTGPATSDVVSQQAPDMQSQLVDAQTQEPIQEFEILGPSGEATAHLTFDGAPVVDHQLQWRYRFWDEGHDRDAAPPDGEGGQGVEGSLTSEVSQCGPDGWQVIPAVFAPGEAVGALDLVLINQNVFQNKMVEGTLQKVPLAQTTRSRQKPFDLEISAEFPRILRRPVTKEVYTPIRLKMPPSRSIQLSTPLLQPEGLSTICEQPTRQMIVATADTRGYAQAYFLGTSQESPLDEPYKVLASHVWKRGQQDLSYTWPPLLISVRGNVDTAMTMTPHWWELRWQEQTTPMQLKWSGNAGALARRNAIIAAIRVWNGAQSKIVIAEEPTALADAHEIEFDWTDVADNPATPNIDESLAAGTQGVTALNPMPPRCAPLWIDRKPVAQYQRITRAKITMIVGAGLTDVNAALHWNVVHEFGHALGLAHNMSDGGAVMASPHQQQSGRPTAPQLDDLRSFSELYP